MHLLVLLAYGKVDPGRKHALVNRTQQRQYPRQQDNDTAIEHWYRVRCKHEHINTLHCGDWRKGTKQRTNNNLPTTYPTCCVKPPPMRVAKS